MAEDILPSLTPLSERLGYHFLQPQLLIQALSHRSFQPKTHNERLEFLGDAILSAIISSALFQRHPTATEGELSQSRAALVCEATLAQLAQSFEVGRYLRLGSGEIKMGGKHRPALLADTLEAIIGAIYLDTETWPPVNQCVLTWYANHLDQLTSDCAHYKDPKTRLQEYLQAHKRPLPHYSLMNQSGTAHAPIFQIACQLPDMPDTHLLSTIIGTGTSRRRAERAAAERLLTQLMRDNPSSF